MTRLERIIHGAIEIACIPLYLLMLLAEKQGYAWAVTPDYSLRPCPFCGQKEDGLEIDDSDNMYYIICLKCFASSQHFNTYKEAKEAWNQRGGEKWTK